MVLPALEKLESGWIDLIQHTVPVEGKLILDVNCEGGIYTKLLARMGASYVTGIATTQAQCRTASEYCRDIPTISILCGSALSTGLIGERYDLVLEHSMFDHYPGDGLRSCLLEAYRLLHNGGDLLFQDRTVEDYFMPGSKTNLRGYFLNRYPRLADQKAEQRPSHHTITRLMQIVGFQIISEQQYWETRTVYPNMDALLEKLLGEMALPSWKGGTEDDMRDFVAYLTYIQEQADGDTTTEIIEQECSTIWHAKKR